MRESFFRRIGSPEQVSIFKNAFFLWSGTAVASALGLVFWAVAARLYAADDVGVASALISAMMLIAALGSLGLGYGVVRYQRTEGFDSHRLLNWAFTTTCVATTLLGLGFVMGSGVWSPSLGFMRTNPLKLVAFIVFASAMAIQIQLMFALLAKDKTHVVLVSNVVAGVGKVLIAVALSRILPAFAMVLGVGVAAIVGVLYSLYAFKRVESSYKPAVVFARPPSAEFLRFCLANYGSIMIASMPTMLLPILVLNLRGEESGAYFYVPWMIASLASSMSTSLGQALFSRGSVGGDDAVALSRRIFWVGPALATAFALSMLVLAPYLLLVFGSTYADEGQGLLRLASIAAVPGAYTSVYLSLLRIKKANVELLLITAGSSSTTLVLAVILMSTSLGIEGAGLAALTSQLMIAGLSFVRLQHMKRPKELEAAPPVGEAIPLEVDSGGAG